MPSLTRRAASAAASGLVLLALATPARAAETWPAETWQQATNLTALDTDWARNLSGAHWNPLTRTLWVCLNAPGKFWALVDNGSGGFAVATKDGKVAEWAPGGDLESISQADLSAPYAYILDEAEQRVEQYDVSVYGTSTLVRAWSLGSFFPALTAYGPEGLTFVPDEWLRTSGFVDGSGAPYTSRNGMGGLWFVAHQNGGLVYVFDLGATSATVELVGSYATSRTESSGLEFDRTSGKLWIWHNTGSNFAEMTDLRSFVRADGKRQFVTIREYVGPKTGNLEGIAVTPASGGTQWYFATDDDCQDGISLLWFKAFAAVQSGPDRYTVDSGSLLTVAAPGVRANDSGTATTALLLTSPAHGRLTGLIVGSAFDGGFQYVPDAGFVGTDTFTYRTNDGAATFETATVTVTVLARPGIDLRVGTSADDAEETATGAVRLTSTDLELTLDDVVQTVGLRFDHVDMPPRAVVKRAYLQLAVDEVDSRATTLEIRAQATDTAKSFTTTTNDLSLRPRTTAKVAWTPAGWTTVGAASATERTPGLEALVQEVVNRPGWARGNALAFLVTGSGRRIAKAWDGDKTGAAVLHLEFEDPPAPTGPIAVEAHVGLGVDDAEESAAGAVSLTSTDLELVEETSVQTVGLRFASLDIPTNVIITRAWLQLTVDEAESRATTLTVRGELAAAAKSFTTTARDISSRPRTGAAVEWQPLGWTTIDAATADQRTPDLSDVVQEIVDLPNWTRGNPLALVVTGTGKRVARAYEAGAAKAPILHVEYVALGPIEAADVRVGASADDAEEGTDGAVALTSTDLELVLDKSVQTVGVRFAAVPVPSRSRIVSAHIQLAVDETGSAATSLAIQGEASAAPAAYTSVARNLSTRARTTVDAVWTPAAWTVLSAAGADQRTPDLAEIVQELVDQEGYDAGRPMAFLFTGSGTRTAEAFDGDPARAPLLHVEFRRPLTPIVRTAR